MAQLDVLGWLHGPPTKMLHTPRLDFKIFGEICNSNASSNLGLGKLFTRTPTFEKILKPRALLVERARKRSTRPQICFLQKIGEEQKKSLHVVRCPVFSTKNQSRAKQKRKSS